MKTVSLHRLSPTLLGVIIAATAFAVYLKTLAPGLTFIDAGELSTVAWTLGISHPTGYPLFSILGWCFAHLPLPVEPVSRMNIMAAVLCAGGLFVFFQCIVLTLQSLFPAEDDRPDLLCNISAAGATLLLAFSETYWSQAIAVEVYSLHLFLLLVVLYAFLRANGFPDTGRSQTGGPGRWWVMFAFLLGLAFTNHMTTILLAPGFLLFYFIRQGWTARSWQRIGAMVIPFFLGLSLYLFFPIRGAEGPIMNWGDPNTLERFLWHVGGRQFRVWIFSSMSVVQRQLAYFFTSFPSEHAYVGMALAFPGLIAVWKRSKELFLLSMLLFVTCVSYSVNYDISDIDSYFLLAYVMVAFWAAFGLYVLGGWIIRRSPRVRSVVLSGVVAIGLIPLAYHYRTADESGDYLVEDYTRNMFASLDTGAVMLSTQWDFWVSAAYYDQLVRGVRTDVTVIDKELLRRSWYFRQLERRYPRLIERSRPEVNAFLGELYKFEHDLPYDGSVIEARYADLIMSFISRNIVDRPVYVTGEIQKQYTGVFRRVPQGLAFRLYADSAFHATMVPDFVYRPFSRHGRLEDATKRLYSSAFVYRTEYYVVGNDLAEARKAIKNGLFYDPSDPVALKWLKVLNGRP